MHTRSMGPVKPSGRGKVASHNVQAHALSGLLCGTFCSCAGRHVLPPVQQSVAAAVVVTVNTLRQCATTKHLPIDHPSQPSPTHSLSGGTHGKHPAAPRTERLLPRTVTGNVHTHDVLASPAPRVALDRDLPFILAEHLPAAASWMRADALSHLPHQLSPDLPYQQQHTSCLIPNLQHQAAQSWL